MTTLSRPDTPSRSGTGNGHSGAPAERFATYNRVSTKGQAEHGLSLAAQSALCVAEGTRRGWTLIEEYVDRGVSGKLTSRPALDRMLSGAKQGQFDYLVIPKLDRLGRSVKGLYDVHELLTGIGVQLVCISPAIDATTPYGRAQLGMLAVFAEFEREMIAERVASVQAERRGRGLHNGRPSYGYRGVEGRWEVEPAEAEIVRRIFREWVGGVSQYAITQRLNADGVRPRRAKEWTQGTISVLLRNRAYVGEGENGETCGCGHPPILEPEVFAQAQALLGGRHRSGGPNRRTVSGHLFLNGYLRCGLCGSQLGPRTDKRHGYEVYKCMGVRNHGAGYCSFGTVDRDFLERGIVERFTATRIDVAGMIARHEATIGDRIGEVAERRAEAERSQIRAAARLDRVKGDYMDGRLSAEDWSALRAELNDERAAAGEEVSRLTAQETALRATLDGRDAEEEVLRFLDQVRNVILAPLRDAETMDALRVGFRRIWPGFVVYPAGSEEAHAFSDGGMVLVPCDADGRWLSPTDAEVPLALPTPANSYNESLTT